MHTVPLHDENDDFKRVVSPAMKIIFDQTLKMATDLGQFRSRFEILDKNVIPISRYDQPNILKYRKFGKLSK